MNRKKWTNDAIGYHLKGRNISCVTNVDNINSPSTTKLMWCCNVCFYEWKTTTDSVVRGSGCPACAGNAQLTESIIQHRLYNDNRKIKVLSLQYGDQKHERRGTFRCEVCEHEWNSILSNVLGKKQGCPRCGKTGRYTDSWFIANKDLKTTTAIFYLMQLSDLQESFLKIGITKRDVKNRYSTTLPYNKKLIAEQSLELYQAYNLEQQTIQLLGRYRHRPQKQFGGKNECFILEAKDSIIKIIEQGVYSE